MADVDVSKAAADRAFAAKMAAAERIMREDRDILRALAKSDDAI